MEEKNDSTIREFSGKDASGILHFLCAAANREGGGSHVLVACVPLDEEERPYRADSRMGRRALQQEEEYLRELIRTHLPEYSLDYRKEEKDGKAAVVLEGAYEGKSLCRVPQDPRREGSPLQAYFLQEGKVTDHWEQPGADLPAHGGITLTTDAAQEDSSDSLAEYERRLHEHSEQIEQINLRIARAIREFQQSLQEMGDEEEAEEAPQQQKPAEALSGKPEPEEAAGPEEEAEQPQEESLSGQESRLEEIIREMEKSAEPLKDASGQPELKEFFSEREAAGQSSQQDMAELFEKLSGTPAEEEAAATDEALDESKEAPLSREEEDVRREVLGEKEEEPSESGEWIQDVIRRYMRDESGPQEKEEPQEDGKEEEGLTVERILQAVHQERLQQEKPDEAEREEPEGEEEELAQDMQAARADDRLTVEKALENEEYAEMMGGEEPPEEMAPQEEPQDPRKVLSDELDILRRQREQIDQMIRQISDQANLAREEEPRQEEKPQQAPAEEEKEEEKPADWMDALVAQLSAGHEEDPGYAEMVRRKLAASDGEKPAWRKALESLLQEPGEKEPEEKPAPQQKEPSGEGVFYHLEDEPDSPEELFEKLSLAEEEQSREDRSRVKEAEIQQILQDINSPQKEEEKEEEDAGKPEKKEEAQGVSFLLQDERGEDGTWKIQRFSGDAEAQRSKLMSVLESRVLEAEAFPPEHKAVWNYDFDTVQRMIGAAGRAGKSDVVVHVRKDSITAQFERDPSVSGFESGSWRVTFEGDQAEYSLLINPLFRMKEEEKQEEEGESREEKEEKAAAPIRRSAEETKKLILQILDQEELSTNALAKKLGYKGISRTLSGIIAEMIEEGVLAYTNPDNPRGSNQKLRKVK